MDLKYGAFAENPGGLRLDLSPVSFFNRCSLRIRHTEQRTGPCFSRAPIRCRFPQLVPDRAQLNYLVHFEGLSDRGVRREQEVVLRAQVEVLTADCPREGKCEALEGETQQVLNRKRGPVHRTDQEGLAERLLVLLLKQRGLD